MKRLSPKTARELSRSLAYVGAATALATILFFLFLVDRGPVWGNDEPMLVMVVPCIALGMATFGLVWLVRIYRRDRDPEAGPSTWRFHKWD